MAELRDELSTSANVSRAERDLIASGSPRTHAASAISTPVTRTNSNGDSEQREELMRGFGLCLLLCLYQIEVVCRYK
jgi:hypothetical protein